MARGKYQGKNRNNKKATTEATKNKKVENLLESNTVLNEYLKNKIKYLDNLANSLLIFLVGVVALFMMTMLIIKLFTPLKYWSFTIFIVIYYCNIFRISGINKQTFKNIFFNLLSVIALYNVLLTFNIANMTELSSNYFISNIAYFYISFLIISLDFNLYKKLDYCIDSFCGILLKAKSNIIYTLVLSILSTYLAITIIITCLSALNVSSNTISNITVILAGILYLANVLLLAYCVNNFKIKDTHEKVEESNINLKKYLKKFENIINEFTEWFIEIFKIERINNTEVINDKGTIKYVNMCVLIISKVVPFLMLILMLSSNAYYASYHYVNNDFCELSNEIKEDTEIIELKRSDVLFFENDTFKTTECKRKPITIELKRKIVEIDESLTNKEISEKMINNLFK